MLGSFEVLDVHGRGGSCVVYRTRYTDTVGNTVDYLLKEFNPQSFAMERDEAGNLICPEKKESPPKRASSDSSRGIVCRRQFKKFSKSAQLHSPILRNLSRERDLLYPDAAV